MKRRASVWILLLALLAGYAFWHQRYVEHAYASPDANGYFAQAGLIATEGRPWFRPESPLQYIGIHWLETSDGRFFSRYPAGLPLLLAAAWRVSGTPDAAFYVDMVLATLTLVFLFLLCRPWVGDGLALVAAVLWALHPTANLHVHFAFAHTAVTFFVVAGLWLLDRWGRTPSRTRAFTAGLVLGMVPTVRYAEAVLAIGVGAFLVWHAARERARWRDLLFAGLGAAIPITLLLVHNHLAFGAPWRTGYSLTNEQTGFSWLWFEQHIGGYLDSLMSEGVGLLFAFALVGIAGMLLQRPTGPLGACLLGVVVPITLVYSAYYFGGGGMGLRFLLPTLPLYLLPALWVFRLIDARRVARVGLGVLCILFAVRGLPESQRAMEGQRDRRHGAAVAVGWVRANVPPGSIVVAERGLCDVLQFFGQWRLAQPDLLLGRGVAPDGRGARRPGLDADPDRPDPMQIGKAEQLRAKYRELPEGERTIEAVNDLLSWAGKGHAIYWIGSDGEVRDFERQSGGIEEFEKVGEFELPAIEGAGGADPGGLGPGGRRPGALPRGPIGGRLPGGPPGLGPPGGGRMGRGIGGGPMAPLRSGRWEVYRLKR